MANDAASSAHSILRVIQILTLIPAWALMAAVVSWYNSNTIKTPGGVMCLFIVTLLASVWAFCIWIAVMRARNTALWIAFLDIIAMGALIAGVATTSNIANYECNGTSINTRLVYTSTGQPIDINQDIYESRNDFWSNPNNCNLIKGAWGLAITNIITFFITAILAVVIYQQNQNSNETVIVEERIPSSREKIYVDGYPQRPRRAQRY
ncbi:hypothetical protein EDC01DRAFT_644937 [Geopyxis carbonaria]|nr:hypothetical protein EDC01DRAFT_644937 [Geopyxis carbonaria]